MPAILERWTAVCLAGLWLAAGAAHADATPIDAYRSATQRALHACARPFDRIDKAAAAADDVRAWRQCAAEVTQAVDGKFDAAMASFMDPVGRAALQRYQAAFLGALEGLPPRASEARNGYDQRQAALRCALSHAWSEFELSEAPKDRRAAVARRP